MSKSIIWEYIPHQYRSNILLSIPLTFIFCGPIQAQDAGQTSVTGQVQVTTKTKVQTQDPDPIKTCMAAQSQLTQAAPKTKKGPVKIVTKALASELSYDSGAMLKDSILVFSAQDIDPYDKRNPPTDKPYTALECRMVDGSAASLIKYPDGSGKVVGGFADGTIIAPTGNDTYIVAYPNGVRGKLVRQPGGIFKVYRPDDSITTFKKTMSGSYEITNDKIGYMGTARTDQLGMQYEFSSSTY